MTTAHNKAVALGLTIATVPGSDPERGYTDAEIVGILQTLTVSDIDVAKVRSWFRENNLWLVRSDGTMFGGLQVAYAAAPQQAKDGLDYLFDTVFGGSAQHLRTTDPVWSVQVKALVDLVVQLSPQASGLVDSFYALDGGRPWLTLTVEQYEVQRVAAEDAAARQAIIDACLTPIAAARDAAGIRLNNATASLAGEHIADLTLEELQARCDAVAASADGLVGV